MSPCKLSEENFKNVTTRGRFSKKRKNYSKFPGLTTSGRHNSAMMTDRRKFASKWSPTGCQFSSFTVRINSKSYPWAANPKFFATSVTTYYYCIARIMLTSVSCTQPITIYYWVTWHYASSNAVSKTACFTFADAKQNWNNKTILSAQLLSDIFFNFYYWPAYMGQCRFARWRLSSSVTLPAGGPAAGRVGGRPPRGRARGQSGGRHCTAGQ